MVDPSPFFEIVSGKVVSHVWQGYGSAIFLELGRLTPRKTRDGKDAHPDGEATLMIEWGWRVERKHSILGGCWSPDRRWPGILGRIKGASVIGVELFGTVPEISVLLSNGLRVASFMIAEGQPRWGIISRDPGIGTLCVKRGRLAIEK
jgi:hypothetical protein